MKASAQSETLTIPAGEFKAKCLKLMDEAVLTQKSFTITKRGKVVGEFVPAQPDVKPFRSIFARTPGVPLANRAEWAKLKEDWANEWDRSTERLARQVNGDFGEDR